MIPTVAQGGGLGSSGGAWGAQPAWDTLLGVGSKTWEPPQGGFFLVGGKEPPLKSKRNDSLSTPLVSCGSLWWVSLWRERPGAERDRGDHCGPSPSTMLWSLQLPPSRSSLPHSPTFSLLISETYAHCPLYVHNAAPFSTYMYIYIRIHISCGSLSFAFFKNLWK